MISMFAYLLNTKYKLTALISGFDSCNVFFLVFPKDKLPNIANLSFIY